MGMDAGKRCIFLKYTARFYKVKGSNITSYIINICQLRLCKWMCLRWLMS